MGMKKQEPDRFLFYFMPDCPALDRTSNHLSHFFMLSGQFGLFANKWPEACFLRGENRIFRPAGTGFGRQIFFLFDWRQSQ